MRWAEGRSRMASGAMFAPLHALLDRLPMERWPTLDELTALAVGVRNARGLAIRFVPPPPAEAGAPAHYETHIFETGEVRTRAGNWHDFFNAAAWIAYPRTKARLNAQHAAILAAGGEAELRHRSPARDALTLFDEGGVIVASSDPALLELVEAFEWKALFWHRRDAVLRSMRFLMFGHAAFEQSLAPYIGMVAKTVFVPAAADLLGSPIDVQAREADALLAAHFADPARFPSPRAMPPLPFLGVPGWHAGAQDQAFYANDAYFRSRPRQRKTGV